MKTRPPRLAERLLTELLSDDVWKTTLGDFEEYYRYLVENQGKKAADRWYWFQLLRFAPSKIIHKTYWSIEMFFNYLKVAYRNIQKNKGYSFINISGMAISLACCFVIVLYVQNELSYDAFHENKDRIYRFTQARSAITPAGYAIDMPLLIPEVEAAARFLIRDRTLKSEETTRNVPGYAFADPDALDIFSFNFLSGNPETALDAPMSLILTQSSAELWFGTQNPVGQTLSINQNSRLYDFQITGVIADLPINSHLKFDYLASFESLRTLSGPSSVEGYRNSFLFTYLLLQEGATAQQVTEKLPGFYTSIFDMTMEEAQKRTLQLQPLLDIHFTTDLAFDVDTNQSKSYVFILGGIALLILVIASINFMNLSTARATLRAQEVGVRKAVGALKHQLIHQFFSESILLSMASIALALILVLLFAPLLSAFVPTLVFQQLFQNVPLIGLLIGIGLATGILASLYPALVLSSFNPIVVLKGLVTRGKRGIAFRKYLIIVQFGISMFLLITMITVFEQLQFMQNKELGFQQEQVIHFPISRQVRENLPQFKENLKSDIHVLHVSGTESVPGRVRSLSGYEWPGQQESDLQSLYTIAADAEYIQTLDLEIIEGRALSPDILTDRAQGYLINETAAKELGWEEVLNHPFKASGREEMGQIVGIVKDFHFQGLQQEIAPMVLRIEPGWYNRAAVRISPANVSETLNFISEQWNNIAPDTPFEYSFLDADFNRLYNSEKQLGQLFSYFTVLAIFIACLGLFGLVAFTANRRTKEIGVRKVLGASVLQLVTLIISDFGKPIFIAALVVSPFTYFALDTWLQNFAYHVDIKLVTFVLGILTILGVSILTASYQSFKAARMDPVNSLRSE